MSVSRIGLSADLSRSGSIHTDTFRRAIRYLIEKVIPLSDRKVELLVTDDGACAAGARTAAHYFAQQRVHAVVGHYASDAAYAALPIYEEANIPLLLPAATSDGLTIRHRNAFRLCPPDKLQIQMMNEFVAAGSCRRVRVVSDESVQGLEMTRRIESEFARYGQRLVRNKEDLVIFLGRFHSAERFIRNDCGEAPVLLSDDVFHPKLIKVKLTTPRQLFVCGLDDFSEEPRSRGATVWHQQLYQRGPSCYFHETIAATEHAVSVLREGIGNRMADMASKQSDTVIGRLDLRLQENPSANYYIWEVTEYGFRKHRREKQYEKVTQAAN